MSKNQKPPDPFERSGRQPYQTLKIPLKTILRDKEALPVPYLPIYSALSAISIEK